MVIPNCSDNNKKHEDYYRVKITSKTETFLLLKIKMIPTSNTNLSTD